MNELRFFREADRAQAAEFLPVIQASLGQVSVTYVQGFEDSTRIRRNHFELWIAPEAVTATLVQQLNDPSEQVRKNAGARLAKDYRSNPQAIGLVLGSLSEQNLPGLSPAGLINALYFLNRSDLYAWTDEHRKTAREAVARIGAINPGQQTSKELKALQDRVSVF